MNQYNTRLRCDLPYYIPCKIALMHAKMQCEGRASLLGLHITSNLRSLMSYSTDSKGHVYAGFGMPESLGYDIEGTLQMQITVYEFKTLEEGIQYVTTALNNEAFLIVSGTSYFLPYSADYLNPMYLKEYETRVPGIVNHWVGLCEWRKEEVVVYDPIPNSYLGTVPRRDFEYYWYGDNGIAELAHLPIVQARLHIYGLQNVHFYGMWSIDDMKERVLSSIKTTAYEYLQGSIIQDQEVTHYIGHQASRKLVSDLAWLIEEYPKDDPIWKPYMNCLFNMRWARYLFRDALDDFCELGVVDATLHTTYQQQVITGLEQIYLLFDISLHRKHTTKERLRQLTQRLDKIICTEDAFFRQVLALHEHYPLMQRASSSDRG